MNSFLKRTISAGVCGVAIFSIWSCSVMSEEWKNASVSVEGAVIQYSYPAPSSSQFKKPKAELSLEGNYPTYLKLGYEKNSFFGGGSPSILLEMGFAKFDYKQKGIESNKSLVDFFRGNGFVAEEISINELDWVFTKTETGSLISYYRYYSNGYFYMVGIDVDPKLNERTRNSYSEKLKRIVESLKIDEK